MKIACLGSAPSSVRLAPFGNPEWQIWACSPGTYSILPRCDAFFELHRWEPGVVGKPDTQRPWFSPEYVAWMGKQKLVWMYEPVPELPGSKSIPYVELTQRWGSYFWTSSLAYMLAMAMDAIIEERQKRKASGMPQAQQDELAKGDAVGLWGVDMSATEEYGYQRAGCQHFLCEANRLGIGITVPPESDLLRPMPPYGLVESTHWHIKSLVRKGELEARLAQAQRTAQHAHNEEQFLRGCIDDLKYHMDTWGDDRQGIAPSPELAEMMKAPVAQLAPAPVVVDTPAQPPAPSAADFIEAGKKLDKAPIPTRGRLVHDGKRIRKAKRKARR